MRFWRNLFHSNSRAGKKAIQVIAAQLINKEDGSFAVPGKENIALPAHLVELKDTYENAMATRYEDFYLRKTRKLTEELDNTCMRGIENIQLMRSGIFHWLSVQKAMEKYRIWVWAVFVLGLAALTVLDFAPTTLVFNTLMEDEGIVPMICRSFAAPAEGGPPQCISYLFDRETITLVAILAFIFGVVMIGHILAKIFFGEYFDRNMSVVGKGILAVTVAIFFVLSGIRFFHEERVSLQKYENEVSKIELAVMNAPSDNLARQASNLQSTEGKTAFLSEYRWKNIFASSLFSIISLIIMLIAIYLSLWREHGEIRYLIRQRKFITSRIRAEEIRSELENISNSFTSKLSQLRQSAQREVAEFLEGVEGGIASENSAQLTAIMGFSRLMREVFNESLKTPDAISDKEKTRLPSSEMDWGSQHLSFIENSLFYDAFEKGAQDAVNIGVRNPNSICAALSLSIALKKDMPNVNDERLEVEYQAGYDEGSRIRYGMEWAAARG